MLLLTVGGAVFGGLCLLLLLCLKQSQSPKSRIEDFLSRASAGPVAHRGGLPENTLTAFRLSKAQGASGVEVDLIFTKDGHPVLCHDDTVDHTSSGTGRVNDLTLEELKSLDMGSKIGSEFAGEQIPTLYEALALCKKLNLLMFLELKEDAEQSAAVINKVFSEDPSLYDRVTVISFYPHIIYKLRRKDPKLLLGLVFRSAYRSYATSGIRRNAGLWRHLVAVLADILYEWSLRTWLWKLLGISLLVVNKNDILGKIFPTGMWEDRNVCVVAWTVNDHKEKTHFENVLKIPYFTDYVSPTETQVTVEQTT